MDINFLLKMFSGPCQHQDIIDDFCQDCGEFIEEETLGIHSRIRYDDDFYANKKEKKTKFSYLTELSRLDLPVEVCREVCCQIETLQERSHVRRRTYVTNLFGMIYIAFNKLQMQFNPFVIGEKLQMDQKQIRAAMWTISKGIDSASCRNPICIIDPSSFIEQMASLFSQYHKLSFEEIGKIKDFIDVVISKNKMIANENPRGIAATVLKIFYDHNNIPIPNFYENVSRTPGYIKSIENSVYRTLNTFEKIK